jgi:hypothetical protein
MTTRRITCDELSVHSIAGEAATFETVAEWIYQQWWSNTNTPPDAIERWLGTHLDTEGFPTTLVAIAADDAIGSVSLHEAEDRPAYKPYRSESHHSRQTMSSMSLRSSSRATVFDGFGVTVTPESGRARRSGSSASTVAVARAVLRTAEGSLSVDRRRYRGYGEVLAVAQ